MDVEKMSINKEVNIKIDDQDKLILFFDILLEWDQENNNQGSDDEQLQD